VEIAGKVVGGIEAVEGLSDTHDIIEYRDADDGPGHMRHRPGNKKHHNFKLVRQYGGTKEFEDWFTTVKNGKTERLAVSITWYNDADEPQSQIHIHDAFPFAYGLDGLDSKSSAHLREYLECVGEHIKYS
jgi:phage tail-like protein